MTVRALSGRYRLLVKGASEMVLSRCSSVNTDSGPVALVAGEDSHADISRTIVSMARNALRTIGLAHRDFPDLPEGHDNLQNPPEHDLVFDGVVGIIDPLRPEVKEAVTMCQRAGIMVRMVTGDNIETAKAIARECGIYCDGGLALEGPAFREMTPAALDKVLPRLQVRPAALSPRPRARLNQMQCAADHVCG